MPHSCLDSGQHGWLIPPCWMNGLPQGTLSQWYPHPHRAADELRATAKTPYYEDDRKQGALTTLAYCSAPFLQPQDSTLGEASCCLSVQQPFLS